MGDRENVSEARMRILSMIRTEEHNNFVIELPVPSNAYPIIIGPGGSHARDIQEKTNTRFELDRVKCVVVIRGR